MCVYVQGFGLCCPGSVFLMEIVGDVLVLWVASTPNFFVLVDLNFFFSLRIVFFFFILFTERVVIRSYDQYLCSTRYLIGLVLGCL